MSALTPELNLVTADDNDDTADYLVLTAGLKGSLIIVDGLFATGTGHTHNGSHQGGIITAVGAGSITSAMIADGAIQTVDIADGAVTSAKLAAGSLLPESLFANTTAVQSANYTVAATILYVFCTAAITVTLPVASANRPITVVAVTGTSTVTAAGGLVVGGSINVATGAVMNGTISPGDSVTYKSDGTNWRAV